MPPTAFRNFTVIRDATPQAAIVRGAVLAIGNFDGVHRGHRAVIDEALRLAKELAAPALAVTFEPHPRHFFQPQVAQFRLTGEHDKLRLLAGAGLDGAVVMAFDAARAATTAEDFINFDLMKRLEPAGLVVGYDFHFGKGRTGTPGMLAQAGARLGLHVHVEARRDFGGQAISSTAIREALESGNVAAANAMLGYPWFVSGKVIHGAKRGRTLGYPTANIALSPGTALRHGIYAVRVDLAGERVDGVASYGRRPQFDNGAPLLEIFLFDFDRDIYGRELDVAFYGFLRGEAQFDGVDALIRQMGDDTAKARAILASAGDAFPALGKIGE